MSSSEERVVGDSGLKPDFLAEVRAGIAIDGYYIRRERVEPGLNRRARLTDPDLKERIIGHQEIDKGYELTSIIYDQTEIALDVQDYQFDEPGPGKFSMLLDLKDEGYATVPFREFDKIVVYKKV